MLQNIDKFKQLWLFHRGLTLDLLRNLSDVDLDFKLDNMGSLGQQFRHLCRVDDQYINAISTGKVENNRKKLDFPVEKSVNRLLELLEYNNKRLFDTVDNGVHGLKIDWTYWGENEFTIHEHLNAMIEHEILHHGELIVYLRIMNKKFPESWKAWGV